MWSEDYGSSFSSKNPLPRGIDRDPSAPLGNVQLSQITINALFTLINLKSGTMDFFLMAKKNKKHTRCLVWQLRGFTDAALIRAFFFFFSFTFCSHSFTRLLTEKITRNSQAKVLCQELRIKKKKPIQPRQKQLAPLCRR